MLGLVGFTTPAEVLVEHKMPRKSFWFVNMKICSPMNSKTHLEPWFIRFNIGGSRFEQGNTVGYLFNPPLPFHDVLFSPNQG